MSIFVPLFTEEYAALLTAATLMLFPARTSAVEFNLNGFDVQLIKNFSRLIVL